MRISDWSSDVCSSELAIEHLQDRHLGAHVRIEAGELDADRARSDHQQLRRHLRRHHRMAIGPDPLPVRLGEGQVARPGTRRDDDVLRRSEEHTSELQSLMRISYAVFWLKKKKNKIPQQYTL